MRFTSCPPVGAFLFLTIVTAAHGDEPVHFVRDVIPALTRSGCNSGACHGSFQGRGGFRLSLLGFDPRADYEALVHESRGRRLHSTSPESSLLLRKATGVMPHGGGKRLHPDMQAYQILRAWIAQGCRPGKMDLHVAALKVTPGELVLGTEQKATLRVSARWSDGNIQDVTAWALFDSRDASISQVTAEGMVKALRPGKNAIGVRYMGQVASVPVSTPFGPARNIDFPASNFIDPLVKAEWERLGLEPAPLSSDPEFLRRVSLDLIGTLPTAEEVRRFLKSNDPEKRRKLIDELLERPEYVDYWSLKWGDLLRVHRRYVGDKGLGSFSGWVKRSIRDNKPLDRMAYELLTAEGNLFTNGPVAYYFVDQKPEELAETTAQLFLGVRLQCARCHHHPFEVWGQDDYYGLAAFFTRWEVRENGEKGRFGGLQVLRPVPHETKKLTVTSPPRLLGAGPTKVDGDPRKTLADWIVAEKNPYFAKNFVNRYWGYLMGKGLVEPLDDLRATNPASNPALLHALAQDFIKSKFDVKHLLRTICNSRAYQLASRIATKQDRDGALFTHRSPRRMPAEVLLDAINQVTGHVEAFDATPPGTRAIALADPSVPSNFLMTFSRPQRNSACECARETAPDLLQALHLINSPALHAKIVSPKGRLATLLDKKLPEEAVAVELYLATLSRRPTAQELRVVREIVAEAPTPREGWEDVLWALLNSPEFVHNH